MAYKKYIKKYEKEICELLELHEREDFGDNVFDYDIKPEDATSWCMIFMMTNLDEEDLGR